MAGLQRFITYIYRYEDDKKTGNAGFAKIEIRGNLCRMEVHIRNSNMEPTEATVYLFARNEKIMQGIPVGSIVVSRGCGDARYAFDTKELLKYGRTIGDMEGLFIPLEGRCCLASQWKEGSLERGLFQVVENISAENQEPKQPENAADAKESGQPETAADAGTVKQPENHAADAGKNSRPENTADAGTVKQPKNHTADAKESGQPETAADARTVKQPEAAADTKKSLPGASSEKAPQNQDQPDSRAEETESAQPIQATELAREKIFREGEWERVFEKLRLKLEICFPFEGKEIECVRMHLNDLREFPGKYRQIGNNSFLLHGFFNYRHILFGAMEENGSRQYFLGVPGVFLNQERIMAAMFGFPAFCTAENKEYKTGNFGYWYRFI